MASDLIKSINTATDGSLGSIAEDERLELLKAIQALTMTLETPLEAIAKTALAVSKLSIEYTTFANYLVMVISPSISSSSS
jgi:Flp pilus assembly CpaF family ATPase